MSQQTSHGPLWAVAVKSLVFTVVTVMATGILATTIRNSSSGEQHTFTAVFTDVTSLNRGDDVRVKGVRVGAVEKIEIIDKRLAKVTFTVRAEVPIEKGATVGIKFRNMVGQRMLTLDQPPLVSGSGTSAGTVRTVAAGPAAAPPLVQDGHEFGVEDTRPALDLTVLFNGFRPLMKMLSPQDVNNLSAQIIAVFQGEDATVDGLISSTASLTSTLAQKDQVIGELITSLSGVLGTIDERSGQLDTLLVTMQQLVSGLAEDRTTIGESIEGMGELSTRVAGMLKDTRPPLRKSIGHLGEISQTLDDHSPQVQNFLDKLPTKLDRIGRTASYGSWLNFYLCSMDGRIPMPQGYMGDLGAKPVAGRCR